MYSKINYVCTSIKYGYTILYSRYGSYLLYKDPYVVQSFQILDRLSVSVFSGNYITYFEIIFSFESDYGVPNPNLVFPNVLVLRTGWF